jgi:hypothetical protein
VLLSRCCKNLRYVYLSGYYPSFVGEREASNVPVECGRVFLFLFTVFSRFSVHGYTPFRSCFLHASA